MLLRISRICLGDEHLALRAPSLLAGLCQLILLVHFLRPRSDAVGALSCAIVLSCSSYTLMIVTEARM